MKTPTEVAKLYRVSINTVTGWIHRGDLAAVNVGTRPNAGKPRWRISDAALAAFEQSRQMTRSAPREARGPRKQKENDVVEFYR